MIKPWTLKVWILENRYCHPGFLFFPLGELCEYMWITCVRLPTTDIRKNDFWHVSRRDCAKNFTEVGTWCFSVWGCCSIEVGAAICTEVCFLDLFSPNFTCLFSGMAKSFLLLSLATQLVRSFHDFHDHLKFYIECYTHLTSRVWRLFPWYLLVCGNKVVHE